MAKKGKNKPNRQKKNEGRNEAPPKRTSARNKNKKHKNSNWKAGNDDPVRLAVEADGSRTIVDMAADGNCLFRALSDQLYGDYGNKYEDIRSEVCDYMDSHEEDFSIFLVLDEDEEDEDAADYESYVGNMREDGEWGGNLELVAAARLFCRNITVFSADLSAFTIPHGEGKTTGPDLLVSYHDNDHYNSVRSNNGVSLSPMSISDDDIDQKHDGELKNGYYSTKANESSGENSKKASVKKSDPCHCGSGQKYKKCCLKREKHVARVKKIQKDDDSDEGDETEKNVDGGFRVMKI